MSTFTDLGIGSKAYLVEAPPYELRLDSIATIEGLMTGELEAVNGVFGGKPLVQQMEVLGLDADRDAPDAIALTIASAMPLASTFDAIYEAAGMPTPTIFGVMCSHVYRKKRFAVSEPYKSEKTRLSGVVEGMSRVVLVDQYLHTGETLRWASDVLQAAGVTTVDTIGGNWFHEGRLNNITGPQIRAGMRGIGRACYRKYVESQI